jgi:sigma-B regulation protein RsbU (phosphoserine phosphatase)
VPAAVFVSNIRALLRAVTRDGSTPGDVLTKVSETVLLDGAGSLYVTCFVAIVDARLRTMFYANAGHPPGLIVGRTARSLSTGGPPLGLLPATRYDDELVTLEPGDLVVVVSDGITDALDASGGAIPERLRAEIVRSHALTPEAVCDALLSITRRAHGPANVTEWSDDRTVVSFRVPGARTPE